MAVTSCQYSQLFSKTMSLQLPGFEYSQFPYSGLEFPSFSDDPLVEQFESFSNRVIEALGKDYLPIYRMADGEFDFLVGWRPPPSRKRRLNSAVELIRQSTKAFLRKLKFPKPPTIWGESYSYREKKIASRRMTEGIQHVSKHGILVLYFAIRGDYWGQQYFRPVCRWLDNHKVLIHQENYIPFYFVYALLNGPKNRSLFDGKHLLVATHLQADREVNIRTALTNLGCASVQFLSISSRRSMLDDIRIDAVSGRVDLAIVAGGIGAINILQQLEPLGVPCIDCGICIECLIHPHRRFERPFLLPIDRSNSNDGLEAKLSFLNTIRR